MSFNFKVMQQFPWCVWNSSQYLFNCCIFVFSRFNMCMIHASYVYLTLYTLIVVPSFFLSSCFKSRLPKSWTSAGLVSRLPIASGRIISSGFWIYRPSFCFLSRRDSGVTWFLPCAPYGGAYPTFSPDVCSFVYYGDTARPFSDVCSIIFLLPLPTNAFHALHRLPSNWVSCWGMFSCQGSWLIVS